MSPNRLTGSGPRFAFNPIFSVWRTIEVSVQVGREALWEREENSLFNLKGLFKRKNDGRLKTASNLFFMGKITHTFSMVHQTGRQH